MREQQVRRMLSFSLIQGRFGSGAAPGGDSLLTSHHQLHSRAVGRQEDLLEPELVEELDGVVAVAAGGNYSLALREDGHVWSWGSTLLGRENSDSVRVGRVEELTKVVSISGGETHAAAVTEDGQVWVWGAAKGWGGKGEVSAAPSKRFFTLPTL